MPLWLSEAPLLFRLFGPLTSTIDFTTLEPKSKTLLCSHPGCDKTFDKPCRLAAHERSHTGERPFVCTFEDCGKTYIEEKHLVQHVNDFHIGIREHPCEVGDCNAAFSTATRLRRHMSTVHAKDKGFACAGYDSCTASFRKRSALERHVRKDHLGLPPFLCPEPHCDAAYDSAGALRNHNNREHGELKYFCDVCNQDGTGPPIGFSIKSQLQNHMRKEHLKCVFCDFTSSSKHNLANHLEMQHTNQAEVHESPKPKERIHCAWEGCERVFTKKSNLNVHVRSAHLGHKFVCGEVDFSKTGRLSGWDKAEGCGQAFASKANLEDHVRHVHLKMKRLPNHRGKRGQNETAPLDEISGASDAAKRTLQCPVVGCEFKFIRNHDLQKHVETYLHLAPDSGGLQEAQQTNHAEVDPVQPFVDSAGLYHDDASGTFDINPGHQYPDLDVYGAAEGFQLGTHDTQPETACVFGTASRNAGHFHEAAQYGSQDAQHIPADAFNAALENTEHARDATQNFQTGNQDVQPATTDAFNAALENADLAQQLATADDIFMPGWGNPQATLVQA